jgi:L-alanine-DL-glutamate epimerase-like enolase superfamily enzyme
LKSDPITNHEAVQSILPPGAARNALDCAFWDLKAKRAKKRVWELAEIPVAARVETSFTISLDEPAKMADAAKRNIAAPILKLKLSGDARDLERVEQVRAVAPNTRLLVDANESWSPEHYRSMAGEMRNLGVELIEQPFPAAKDDLLKELDHPVPVCADESCHTTADLPRVRERYDAINVKLDKTGGFTEALRLTRAAREAGLRLLFGCMVCTSLGIAPARLLVAEGDWVDLDGPLLLAADRHPALHYRDGSIDLPVSELWG